MQKQMNEKGNHDSLVQDKPYLHFLSVDSFCFLPGIWFGFSRAILFNRFGE